MKPKVSVMGSKEATLNRLKGSFDEIYGTYDLETEEIELMGIENFNSFSKIVKVIDHEYMHWVLDKEVNQNASIALDNIDTKEKTLGLKFE